MNSQLNLPNIHFYCIMIICTLCACKPPSRLSPTWYYSLPTIWFLRAMSWRWQALCLSSLFFVAMTRRSRDNFNLIKTRYKTLSPGSNRRIKALDVVLSTTVKLSVWYSNFRNRTWHSDRIVPSCMFALPVSPSININIKLRCCTALKSSILRIKWWLVTRTSPVYKAPWLQ